MRYLLPIAFLLASFMAHGQLHSGAEEEIMMLEQKLASAILNKDSNMLKQL